MWRFRSQQKTLFSAQMIAKDQSENVDMVDILSFLKEMKFYQKI